MPVLQLTVGRPPGRRTAVSAVKRDRGRTAYPWSQAGRLRSPPTAALAGGTPALPSRPSPKASAPEYSPVAALRTGVFLCGLFLMPLLGRAVSISFRSRRRYTAVSRPYG